MSLAENFCARKSEQFEGAPDRRFFTMLPNLIDDIGLSPRGFRLYCHLKRVVGEGGGGTCFQSTKTLATACRMSTGAVSAAKRELNQPRPELNGRALINVTRDGGGTDHITVNDIWSENFKTFSSPQPKASRRVHLVNADVQNMNKGRSDIEIKKELLSEDKEITHEEVNTVGGSPSAPPSQASAGSVSTELPPDLPSRRPHGHQPSKEERRVRQKLWEAVDLHFGKFPIPLRETREANAIAELSYQIEVTRLFTLPDALACFDEKRGEVWRTSPVSMFTVWREISQWLHTREARERDGTRGGGSLPSSGRYPSAAERSEERLRERDYEADGVAVAARVAATRAAIAAGHRISRFDRGD